MTLPERSAAAEQQVYRALASPVRNRLLEVLRDEADLDAATLAERLGLHVNTVRAHLNLLEDAGLVDAAAEDRDRPGRPRRLYRARADEPPSAPGDEGGGYRFLAAILASYLNASGDDGSAAAEQAGRAWGGFVIDEPAPFSRLDPEEGMNRLVAMLEEVGFAPELVREDDASPRLLLRRCPFLEVAREHPEVVCAVHLGLMRGALDELGVDVQAQELIPWAQPDGCVAHLHLGTAGR